MKNLTPLAVLIGAAIIAGVVYVVLGNKPELVPTLTVEEIRAAVQEELQAAAREEDELEESVTEPEPVKPPTVRAKVLNVLDAHTQDIRTILISVEERFRTNKFRDIERHAGETGLIIRETRLASADLSRRSYEMIRRDLSELQHAFHKIKEGAHDGEREGVHHAYETALRHLGTLDIDLQKLKSDPPLAATPIEKTLNILDAHTQDMRAILISVAESFRFGNYSDIEGHADELEKITQQVRNSATDLPQASYDVISRIIKELQHATHELEEAANSKAHEDSHHAHETALRYVDMLDEDIDDIARRLL